MATVFTTRDVQPRDAVAYWTEIVTRRFYNYMLPRHQDVPFGADMRTGQIDFLGVASYASSAYISARTQREIDLSECRDYYVCLQLTGLAVHSEGQRDTTLTPGSFFILDAGRPFVGQYKEASHQIAIRIPRQKIDAHFGDTHTLTTRTFNGQNPIAALMFGFFTMLPERMDALDGVAAAKIADQAVDLLILALQTELQSGTMELSSPRASALIMLKLAVDTHLRDPSLKPATAAAAAGISVRYANALLAEEGTGLEGYIIARRLDQSRKALEDPSQGHRTISEIAFSWGFADVSHFTRRFKAAYGCTPGEYRKVPPLVAQAT